jgi:regulator of protease activity HflC (stomatin/prohibitin superfamily)
MSFLVSLAFLIAALLTLRRLAREARDREELVALRGMRVVAMLVFVAAAIAALAHCIRVVPAGHVGVVDFFGTVDPRSRPAGLQWVNPLARLIPMSVKTQELKETMEVPTREGLSLSLEVSVLFHLDPAKAPEVYRTVGPNYVDVILVPQFRSVARGVTASSEARALYTSEREQLAEQIASGLRQQVEARGIVIEATPLRKIVLPQRLAQAIEEKLSAEQESQRMEFVLQREAKEAERKRIEAQGIADFQRIVSQGISDQLLRWKGIEATIEIAKSPNTKVVVVGAGKDGLPLILGSER